MSERVVIPTGASAREVLAALDGWALHTDEEEVRHVWHVLTAMRGPDLPDPEDAIKWATTAKLRGAVLPTLAGRAGAFVIIGTGEGAVEELMAYSGGGGGHFSTHLRFAATTLLDWFPERARHLANWGF